MNDEDGNKGQPIKYIKGVEHLTRRQTLSKKGNLKEFETKRRLKYHQEVKIHKVPTCNCLPNLSTNNWFNTI